jgi:predicted PurR-regulated permease PerM
MQPQHDLVGGAILLAIAIAVYLFPSIVAMRRRHHRRLAIFMLNLLLGWSGLAWIVALIWACTRVELDNKNDKLSFHHRHS